MRPGVGRVARTGVWLKPDTIPASGAHSLVPGLGQTRRSGSAAVVRVTRDEDRRVRQAGPGRDRPQAPRPRDPPSRPVGRGRVERHRRQRGRGGAAPQGVPRRRGGGRLARPREGDGLAPQGTRDGRGPCGARLRRGRRRLRPRRDELRAGQGARARGGRPRPVRAAVQRRRRRGALGRRLRPAAPADGVAGRGADARRREPHGQAADGVRLRRDLGATARGRRRLGRHQRASLPVAQGDHGGEVEAAGGRVAGRRRRRGRSRRHGRLAHDRALGRAAAREERPGPDRGRRQRRREDRRVPRREEARSDEHPRLPRDPRRRTDQGRPRPPLEGRVARRRGRRRRPRERRP